MSTDTLCTSCPSPLVLNAGLNVNPKLTANNCGAACISIHQNNAVNNK